MNYTHFVQTADGYKSKRIGYLALLFGVFWFTVLMLASFRGGKIQIGYAVFGLVLLIALSRLFAQQMEINLQKRTISRSYFGLLKKEFSIAEIRSFELLRHLQMGFHNGTDVIVYLQGNKKITLIERVGRSKNASAIADEIRAIINQQ